MDRQEEPRPIPPGTPLYKLKKLGGYVSDETSSVILTLFLQEVATSSPAIVHLRFDDLPEVKRALEEVSTFLDDLGSPLLDE